MAVADEVNLRIDTCHTSAACFAEVSGELDIQATLRAASGSAGASGTASLRVSYPLFNMLGETVRNACVNAGIDPDTHDGCTRNVRAFAWSGEEEGVCCLDALDPCTNLGDALSGCTNLLLLR